MMTHLSGMGRDRRKIMRRHRFLPLALRLEERALMTTLGSDFPVGAAAESGTVYVSHFDSSDPVTNREDIEAFSSSGAELANVLISTGSNALPGALQALGSSAGELNVYLDPADILELQPDGELYTFRPSTGQTGYIGDLADLNAAVSSVYDVQTARLEDFTGYISMSNAEFGDFGVDGNDLVVSGESNGFDFVARVGFANGAPATAKVLASSAASDGGAVAPKGVAVNAQGTVLTSLPFSPSGNLSQGIDVPVGFNLFFDQDDGPAPTVLTFGLSTYSQIDSREISTDANGDFVMATGPAGSSLTGGEPGIVELTADLNQFSAQAISQSEGAMIPWGVTVDTVNQNLVLTYPYQDKAGTSSYLPPLSGYDPGQIRHAYGVDQIELDDSNGNVVQGTGLGQTIAIIEQGYDPTIAADLHHFDQTFGLPDPPAFVQVNQYGGTSFGAVDPGTIDETSLDVEWAHAMAPEANILLVEANTVDIEDPADTADVNDFFAAVRFAGSVPGVSVISMSYGFSEYLMPLPGTSYDSSLTAPGVTYVASAGDHGFYTAVSPGNYSAIGVEYPAESPDVLAVGGTTLQNLDAAGDYPGTTTYGEIGWGNGVESNTLLGGGGGASSVEREPEYQSSVQSTGARTIPDVAWDANPATGFDVYFSTMDDNGQEGWAGQGGTSAGAPQWAGLIAIVDEGLALQNHPAISGGTQTLPAIYALSASDFHDVTIGNNGYQAGPGYDLVTGLGSPIANQLVPAMVDTFLVQVAGGTITTTAGSDYSGPVGSFAINEPGFGPADYAATIAWGDGTTSNGTIAANGQGGYYILGSHAYAEPGSFQVTITLSDVTGYTVHGSSTANVAVAPLHASPQSIAASAGTVFDGVVATFTDGDLFDTIGDYAATITWGDGTSSPGTFAVNPAGGYEVVGVRTYVNTGSYPVTVTITDLAGASAVVDDTADVTAAPLDANPQVISAIDGNAFSGVVATFTDGDPFETIGDYAAVINWGDGTTSTGTVVTSPGGGYDVFGGKTYASAGSYAVTVAIGDLAGARSVVDDAASVTAAPLSANTRTISATDGNAFSGVVATFTDGDPLDTLGDYRATIAWGNGRSTPGNIGVNLAGGYSVTAGLTLTSVGSFPVTVTISDVAGASTVVDDSAHVVAAPLSASALALAATDGNAWGGAVATFKDGDPLFTPVDLSAIVLWGDGTTSTGVFEPGPGSSYTVLASKTYVSAGAFPVNVLIADAAGSHIVVSSIDQVSPAPLAAYSSSISAAPKKSFNGPVAIFTDGDPLDSIGDYSATISWGDKATSAGALVQNPGGGYQVVGTHAYKKTGNFTVVVTIRDLAGVTASVAESARISNKRVAKKATDVGPMAGTAGNVHDLALASVVTERSRRT
jgi:hypothetical protein